MIECPGFPGQYFFEKNGIKTVKYLQERVFSGNIKRLREKLLRSGGEL